MRMIPWATEAQAAMIVSLAALGLVALWSARCWLGFHPKSGRRMRTGYRDQRGNSVTEWECARCLQTAAIAVTPLQTKTLRTLRSQVGTSRLRSRVFRFQIVPKKDEAVS